MIIVLNKDAGAGTALTKWNRLYKDKIPGAIIYDTSSSDKTFNIKKMLRENINKGNYEFAAAGGDGTLNHLLNSLLEVARGKEIKNLKIGAIGIGSSNDFHKPINKIGTLPIKIDFSNAEFRDVGYFIFTKNGNHFKKYFLINASIGITAEGNYRFNTPSPLLKHIKQRSSKWAIIYTAVKTLLQYKNQAVQLYTEEWGLVNIKLTNLGVIKNPNFSGNLSYGGKPIYDNGLLQIHLCANLNIFDRLKLFGALQRHKYNLLKNVSSLNTKEIVINAEQKFYVEFDGEIIKTDYVKFGIHHKHIKVCQ